MNNFFSYPLFKLDQLNGFVAIAIGIFSLLVLLYSFKFMQTKGQGIQYYICIVTSAILAIAAALANNLILLLVFWGFLGLTLYLLINMGGQDAHLAAKKSLIIVGGTDALMLLGIGIIYYFSSSFQIDQISLELNNAFLISAYLCIAFACFAKAGAVPFHSWLPDCAASCPLPVSAFLPAALDKLLGIYLLMRISLDLFTMNAAMNAFLLIIGASTIIAAVMMALMQHNLKRLLAYHAVSQVGYMVLGIGTANPLGIAGGLFHMLNNAIYKSCLFFTAGNVEYRAKTSELDKLGGLARLMPITYVSCLIASLSISGIPPFNGFVSKWLIYQGLLLNISQTGPIYQLMLSAFCLVAAMFGSALTLASFMKLLHALFLGERLNPLGAKEIKEVPWQMWLPPLLLAAVCVLFGIFAFSLPLRYLIFPAISLYWPLNVLSLLGIWSPGLATLLIVLGLVLGFAFLKINKAGSSLRQDSAFTGGEGALAQENMVTGAEFYNTIQDMPVLRSIYKKAGEGSFDIYEQAKKIFCLSRLLQYLHNGVLPTYLVWVLLGMVGLFLALLK